MNESSSQEPTTETTLGTLVALAFDEAEDVALEPARAAELASRVVMRNLLRSPRNVAATARLLRQAESEQPS